MSIVAQVGDVAMGLLLNMHPVFIQLQTRKGEKKFKQYMYVYETYMTISSHPPLESYVQNDVLLKIVGNWPF